MESWDEAEYGDASGLRLWQIVSHNDRKGMSWYFVVSSLSCHIHLAHSCQGSLFHLNDHFSSNMIYLDSIKDYILYYAYFYMQMQSKITKIKIRIQKLSRPILEGPISSKPVRFIIIIILYLLNVVPSNKC